MHRLASRPTNGHRTRDRSPQTGAGSSSASPRTRWHCLSPWPDRRTRSDQGQSTRVPSFSTSATAPVTHGCMSTPGRSVGPQYGACVRCEVQWPCPQQPRDDGATAARGSGARSPGELASETESPGLCCGRGQSAAAWRVVRTPGLRSPGRHIEPHREGRAGARDQSGTRTTAAANPSGIRISA